MKRLLIVDDSQVMRKVLKTVLSAQGFDIVGECCDGNEVLPFLQLNLVDLVIMDYEMKIMNGVETTRIVRQSFPKVTIIGYSGCTDKFVENAMVDAGVDTFIYKETGIDELVYAITQHQ